MSPRVNDSANAGAGLLSSIANPISRIPLSKVTVGLIVILSGGPVTTQNTNCYVLIITKHFQLFRIIAMQLSTLLSIAITTIKLQQTCFSSLSLIN